MTGRDLPAQLWVGGGSVTSLPLLVYQKWCLSPNKPHVLISLLYSSQPKFDIALPLNTAKFGKASFETLPFVAIVESIGIAVLKHSNVSGGKLMSSIIQAWPVLLFIILAACIAGIIIWFVVSSLSDSNVLSSIRVQLYKRVDWKGEIECQWHPWYGQIRLLWNHATIL